MQPLLLLLAACGGASQVPLAHPEPRPEEEPAVAVARVEIIDLEAPIRGADRVPEGTGEIELVVGANVLGTLDTGTHDRQALRNALFVPNGPWADAQLGEARVHLRGDEAETLATWLETLDLELPSTERWVATGTPVEVAPLMVVESLWDSRIRILGTLLMPEGPAWARDAWATYQLARSKPGVPQLIDRYVAHRARVGIAVQADPAGAFLASFCVDVARETQSRIPPAELLEWGERRAVVDLDACLAHVDARLVAHVVPIYEPTSIRSLFRGATVEGTPPSVVRSPGPLRPGDVITHVRGQPIASLDELGRHIGHLEPRHQVSIAMRRGERTIRMWLRVPAMEIAREVVVFEIQPDPAQHPRWPWR